MFSRISTAIFYAFFAFAILAAATPGNQPVTTTVTVTAPASTTTVSPGQCTTGDLQCCDSTTKAGSVAGAAILGLIGVVVEDVNVLLGLTCSPITVVGVESGSCTSNVVCCEDNAWGSLVSIGCVPVTL
ncbi:fungal hydrophobin [Lentinula raphanica]|nr:fungal hydrophobin [Lentinula raphanica]